MFFFKSDICKAYTGWAIGNALFNQNHCGAMISSISGKIIQVNKKLCDILGYSEEELEQSGWENITHPEDLGLDLEQANRCRRKEIKGYTIRKRFLSKNGKYIWADASINKLNDGVVEPNMFICIISPVDEHPEEPHEAVILDETPY